VVVNFNKKFLNGKYISKILSAYDYAIKYLKIPCSDLEINVNFVRSDEIRELNYKFRSKDAETDVLSFPSLLEEGKTDMQLITDKLTKENFQGDINFENGCIFLGDICICKKVAFANAKKYGTKKLREIVYMALHGFLHLVGFDHMKDEDKKIMRKAEEEILKYIDLERK